MDSSQPAERFSLMARSCWASRRRKRPIDEPAAQRGHSKKVFVVKETDRWPQPRPGWRRHAPLASVKPGAANRLVVIGG